MKKDRISEVYTEFENSYKGKSKEEMDKVVSDNWNYNIYYFYFWSKDRK